jgi:RHS repeat-associated protein
VVTRANGEQHSIAYTGNSGGRPHTFTNPVGRVHHKTYFGGNGMTASRTDDLGRTTTYQSTPLFGAVTVKSNSVEGTVRYTYTNPDRPFYLASITDEQGRVIRHTRDANHRVTRTDYPDGTYEAFTFGPDGALTTQRFRDGTTESYQYNAKGLRTATTRASGLVETFAYDAHDRLVTRSNSLGQVWTTTYTWRGLPLVQRHPDGSTDQHSYNRYGQVTQTINRIGARTVFTYDAHGHLASTRDALGHTLTVSNNLLGLPVRTTLPSGLTVQRTYDGLDRVLSETWLSDTTAVRKFYGPLGLTSQVSRAGAVRVMTRDLEGRVIAERDPLGRVTSTTYDADGNRLTVTNPDGGVLRFRYDLNNRPVSATDCQGHTTSNVYDQAGRLVRQISATGIVTSNRYDAAGRLVSRHQGGLLLASNRYNAAGWVVWTRNEDGIAVTNTYDLAGRLVRATLPDGSYTEQVYSNGLLVAAYDRARRVTRYQHNALGRVTNQIDNAGHAVAYTYNAAGNLTELRDQNGQRTRFVFDAEGRQTMKIYDDGTVHTYDYDAEGRLVARTDALGRTTRYHYDLAGNLLVVDYPTNADVAFTYDALNRRIRMVDGVGTSSYTYAEGCTAMTGEDGPFSQNDALAYTYDADKRLTGVALGTTTWTYAPDVLGRIAAIGSDEGTYTYTYAQSGRRPLQLSRPNGVHTHVAYDALMMATSLMHRTMDGVILDGRDYRYDAAGQRSWERRNGEEIDYGYDPIGQVVSAKSRLPGYDFSYAYDPAGNPLRQSKNGFVMSNAFNRLNQILGGTWSGTATVLGEIAATGATVRVNNRVAALLPAGRYAATGIPLVAGTNALGAVVTDAAGRSATSRVDVVAKNKAYGHDLNGNMTNDTDKVYVWDEENRLIRVTERGTGKVLLQNRYDGLSRRRERIMLEQDGSYSTNRYVYQGWLVKAVLNGRNERIETYTHGPDLTGSLEGAGGIGGILAERINGTTRWYHADLMGNITLITTPAREAITRITYDPFGHVLEQKGPPPRYQFSSKECDAAVGLNYYGYRFYSAQLGRWISRDPLSENGGINLFQFVNNNSHGDYDYLGMIPGLMNNKNEIETVPVFDKEYDNCNSSTSRAITENINVEITPFGIGIRISSEESFEVAECSRASLIVTAVCRLISNNGIKWPSCAIRSTFSNESCN